MCGVLAKLSEKDDAHQARGGGRSPRLPGLNAARAWGDETRVVLNKPPFPRQALMSELNDFIQEAALDGGLATRLRAYFRHLHRTDGAADCSWLLDRMTPALRGAVALAMHSDWIGRLSPFAGCPQSMVIRLSFAFRPQAFPPDERLELGGHEPVALLVLRRGLALSHAPELRGGGRALALQARRRGAGFEPSCEP